MIGTIIEENIWLKKMLDFMFDNMIDVDQIFWHEGFHANCSDLFWWACADAEDITDETFSILEKALEDTNIEFFIWLYSCRQRKMRPQGAAYKYIPEKFWKLFDECGPERKSEFGNPKERPKDKS